MSKVVVMLPGHCFKLVEVPDKLVLEDIKKLVGGFFDIALRVPRIHIKKFLPNAFSTDNLIVLCDGDGYMKRLLPTWCRPTDNFLLVGPVAFLRYEAIWHDDGPDESYHPLTSVQQADIISWLKKEEWVEVMLDEIDYKKSVGLGGGEVGVA